ncbi:protein kinase rad3-like [Sitophilus oryzae]|uniref:Protein kinase rad3-like n=1 Tax=Sitophilus oryzae TaxID=7048 RepID=A0A6J2YBM3_SITOR|nr:protein kinase rad3-like [Sitophilus oryzae]
MCLGSQKISDTSKRRTLTVASVWQIILRNHCNNFLGESFEWPERVPFRLTQNMVSAMGPLGVEGVFRKSCEFTLRVLRSNAPTLMSIVTPFVYDPLVSWPRHVAAAAQSSERVNEQALEHIKISTSTTR